MSADPVEVHQPRDGRAVEHRGRRGASRSVVIDRKWEVSLDGEVISYETATGE